MDKTITQVVEMTVNFRGKEIKGTPDEMRQLKVALENVFGRSVVEKERIVYQYPPDYRYYQDFYGSRSPKFLSTPCPWSFP